MEARTPPASRAMREGYSREGDRAARLSGRLKTLLAMAKKSGTAPPVAGSLAKDDAFVPLIAFLVIVLSRPYRRIVQEAHIDIGRALADLDLAGVGRDLMFVHDGQFGFSLFRLAAAAMVWCLGLGIAAKTLAILAAFAWFFWHSRLRPAIRQRRHGLGGRDFTVLLPNNYGAPYPLGFAELIAIPRPFTEALVFAALAALAANRGDVSSLFIAAAALLHPIMAMAGMGVFVTVRCMEDKRWVWFCAISCALLIVAGALGLPLVDRLFMTIDPSLRSLHEQRSPFLFPSPWPMMSFPPLIVQATTLAIAAHFQHGRRRTILAAILWVGLGGIAIAAIFGDWLMAAAAAMALGVASVSLWRGGPKRAPGLGFPGALLVVQHTICGCWSPRDLGASSAFPRRAVRAVIGLWDYRPHVQRMMEENQRPPELMRLIDQRQGEVAEWRRQMQILMDLRLADQKRFAQWADPASADLARLSQDGVRRLCALDDVPAFVIALLEHGKDLPNSIEMNVWPLPQPQFLMTKADNDFIWRKIDAYGVIACGNAPHK